MKDKTLRQRLGEALFDLRPTEEIKQGTAVIGSMNQSSGVTPSESFKDQVDLLNKDPVVKSSIEQFAEQVISTGIYTTMNDLYKTKLPDVNGINRTAKEIIDKWNKDNDMDNKILQIAIELKGFGNSFWYIGEDGFSNIPVEAIQRTKASTSKIPIIDRYDLITTGTYGSKTIKNGTFIHFRINITGNAPFGSGVCSGLVATPDDDTPSMYSIRKSVRASMKEGFEKFSFGNELWSFDGMSDEKIDEIGTKVANMDSTGQRITTNTKGDIKLSVPQRTQSYDKWIEQIDKEFYKSLGGGLDPDTQYTTKATAQAVAEAFKYSVMAMRRAIKRQIEALWNKLLDDIGFDSTQANVRLNFGSEEFEYNAQDVFNAVTSGIITKDEARTILQKYAHWEISGNKVPDELPVEEIKETLEKTNKAIEVLNESKISTDIELKQKQIKLLDKLSKGDDNEDT